MTGNRVKDYYEVAVKFLSLPPMARYVIGTTIALMKYEEFILNEEERKLKKNIWMQHNSAWLEK